MNFSGCGEQYQRPTGKICPALKNVHSYNDSNDIGAGGSGDVNRDILKALTSVSSRLTAVESRISKMEERLSQQSISPSRNSEMSVTPNQKTTGRQRRTSSSDDDTLTPRSVAFHMRVFHWNRPSNHLYGSRVSCKSRGIGDKNHKKCANMPSP